MRIIKYKDANFQKVQGFADKALCNYLAFYSLQLAERGKLREGDSQTYISKILRNIPIYEALLAYKLPSMESLCRRKLFATYSYGRIYRNGSILAEHRDRPACEYSVSLAIGCSKKFIWPIYMYDKNNKKRYISLGTGDAVIYKGYETTHGRDPLLCKNNEYLIQIFLHYVDANGPHAREKFDRRKSLKY